MIHPALTDCLDWSKRESKERDDEIPVVGGEGPHLKIF